MLSVKASARITKLHSEMVRALPIADEICNKFGVECVVTSANDSKHMAGSLHYVGRAIDLRTRTMKPGNAPRVVQELKRKLGPDFDIVLESDHIHIEYDPKGIPT